jgi:hypothetical protein
VNTPGRRYWFGPKRWLGWGWTPTTWEGWAVTGGSIVIFTVAVSTRTLAGTIVAVLDFVALFVVMARTGTKPGGPGLRRR